MRIVFLRGSVPPKHENPEKLLYSHIDECEDQWTQLFYHLCLEMGASGELLYDKGNKKVVMTPGIIERWVPNLSKYNPKIKPDLIIARGGFPYYDPFIKRFPNAKKVYYGAGARHYPKTDFKNYDLFLVDSKKQKQDIANKGKNVKLLIKPAAKMFRPHDVAKGYDICFMANATQAPLKRHRLFIETFSNSGLRILSLGNTDQKIINYAKEKNTDITWGGWSLRKHLPERISSCKIGVVCCTNYDSCPRVIPEYLACGIPIVATKNMNFWHEKYVNPDHKTGLLVDEADMLESAKSLIDKKWDTYSYYMLNLCVGKAAKDLAEKVGKIL